MAARLDNGQSGTGKGEGGLIEGEECKPKTKVVARGRRRDPRCFPLALSLSLVEVVHVIPVLSLVSLPSSSSSSPFLPLVLLVVVANSTTML